MPVHGLSSTAEVAPSLLLLPPPCLPVQGRAEAAQTLLLLLLMGWTGLAQRWCSALAHLLLHRDPRHCCRCIQGLAVGINQRCGRPCGWRWLSSLRLWLSGGALRQAGPHAEAAGQHVALHLPLHLLRRLQVCGGRGSPAPPAAAGWLV